MIIKTLQWNIGGGKIRKPGDDSGDDLAYCNDGLASIIETIRRYGPDIVTLQESHSDKSGTQTEEIAKELGLPFFINDEYADSHLEEGKKLSQAIISRYPIEQHAFTSFLNPHLETTGPKGDRWLSHDKGVTSCQVKIGDKTLNIKTSHSIPFRRFKVDFQGEVMTSVRRDMAKKLKPDGDLYLYQGDLNYDNESIKIYLSQLLEGGVREVLLDSPTTPNGRRYDHVLYREFKHLMSQVISDVLTDHFPVYSEFEIG